MGQQYNQHKTANNGGDNDFLNFFGTSPIFTILQIRNHRQGRGVEKLSSPPNSTHGAVHSFRHGGKPKPTALGEQKSQDDNHWPVGFYRFFRKLWRIDQRESLALAFLFQLLPYLSFHLFSLVFLIPSDGTFIIAPEHEICPLHFRSLADALFVVCKLLLESCALRG